VLSVGCGDATLVYPDGTLIDKDPDIDGFGEQIADLVTQAKNLSSADNYNADKKD